MAVETGIGRDLDVTRMRTTCCVPPVACSSGTHRTAVVCPSPSSEGRLPRRNRQGSLPSRRLSKSWRLTDADWGQGPVALDTRTGKVRKLVNGAPAVHRNQPGRCSAAEDPQRGALSRSVAAGQPTSAGKSGRLPASWRCLQGKVDLLLRMCLPGHLRSFLPGAKPSRKVASHLE